RVFLNHARQPVRSEKTRDVLVQLDAVRIDERGASAGGEDDGPAAGFVDATFENQSGGEQAGARQQHQETAVEVRPQTGEWNQQPHAAGRAFALDGDEGNGDGRE